MRGRQHGPTLGLDKQHRFYIAAGDSRDAENARRAVGDSLPAGWVLSNEPELASAILTIDVDIDADIVKRAGPTLRIIGTAGPSVESRAITGSRVKVVDLPKGTPFRDLGVAEHTVWAIITLTRGMLATARATTEHPWIPDRDVPALTDQKTYVYNWTGQKGPGYLYNKVVGVIGVGAIGSIVARLLAPFGVRLLYTQRHRLDEEEERRLGVEWRKFDDLIRESDVITLHMRFQEGSEGNEHQFSGREFSIMKSTAFLVNTSRGRVIDEDALVEALHNGEIAGIALDVFRYEPLPKDHPLLALVGDNVILTPHVAAGPESVYWDHVLEVMIGAYSSEEDGALD
jgi:phosphoglycerate dehydrogenase-like enzyme